MEIGKRKIWKGVVNGVIGVAIGLTLAYGYEFCLKWEEAVFSKGNLDEKVQSILQWDERKIISELKHWEMVDQFPNDYCDNFSMKDLFSISFLSARLGMISPQKGMDLLPEIPEIAPHVSRRLFCTWSERRPEEAFACFKQKGTTLSAHKKILLPVARNLIKSKPEAMPELLDSLPEEQRESFTPVAFSFLMKFHPELILCSLSEWGGRGTRTKKMYAEIAREWAAEDWESAQAWIRTLPPRWHEDLRLFSLPGLMEKNEAEASRIFIALTEQDQKRVLPFFLKTLTSQFPLKALKWLSEHVSEDMYLEHVEMAMGNGYFVSSDVKDFIISMKDENIKDQALYYMYDRYLLFYITRDDKTKHLGYYKQSPEEVLKWICLMSDLKRKTYLGNNFVVWASYDHERAYAWLNESNFAEENRQIIESCLNISKFPSREIDRDCID